MLECFIVVAFSLALLPKLPALFGSGERVINSAVLLALVAVTLLLFNAAYREGDLDPGYGRWLQHALRVVPPLLVLVALTALYSMSVRLIELGLTPSRYWGLVTAIFAVLYAVGYAYASLRAGPWLGAISRVNFGVSVILLVTLVISLTPIADPLRLSVASQLKRALAASTVDARASALQFLRFDSSEHGRNVLNAIRAALPADALVFSDMTQIAYLGNYAFACDQPRLWHHPSGYGTLGYALPAAIGARVAYADRAVVALAGDYGVQFTVQELGTAVELGRSLPIIVWNNSALGQIRDDMIASGIAPIGVVGHNPDFVALAQAWGARGERVGDAAQLTAALRAAQHHPGPTVIEVDAAQFPQD